MCGIWALFGYDSTDVSLYQNAFKITHRGPDCFQSRNSNQIRNVTMMFHRLCIEDNVRGMQPMTLVKYPHLTLMCNGEIYNFKTLKGEFGFQFETACDVEIILHLYVKFGIKKTAQLLDGSFAFMILDTSKMKVMLGRGTYGLRPMFYFTMPAIGALGVCSEVKGLVEIIKAKHGENETKIIRPFLPAHLMIFDVDKNGKTKLHKQLKFHALADRPMHWQYQGIKLLPGYELACVQENIRALLTNAVEKRLKSMRRIGSFLSGGLDSSLVTAITAEKLKEQQRPHPVQTFAIGFEESPDLIAARKVAKHIGTEHHEIFITAEEALTALDEVIYTTETHDRITVRTSTALYLLSKYVKEKTDTVVMMSGEGADEVCQGHIYFHKQPTPEEGDRESRRLLKDLYLFDLVGGDRATAAHGLEVRHPFLDHAFVSYYLSIPAELRAPKNRTEKYLLRSSFENTSLIPDDILWRRKEGFSDGVSSIKNSWYNILQAHLETKVSDEQLADAAARFPVNTPLTKEAYYYRQVFEKHFGQNTQNLVPYHWLPKWVGDLKEPSAKVISYYQNEEKAKKPANIREDCNFA